MANKILIVEDNAYYLKLIDELFSKEGFETILASTAKEAFERTFDSHPDVIVLDLILPDFDGLEVCRKLRQGFRAQHIPIIMLTSRSNTDEKIIGFEEGADDYMTKPFENKELLARVKSHIRRAELEKSVNPLTHLPGNIWIQSYLEELIKKKTKFSVLYIDLDNFKAFNDVYGFTKGDQVIKFISSILIKLIEDYNRNEDDFIGHIGGDDFILITKPKHAEEYSKEIISRFEKRINNFYSEKDRIQGFIITSDRQSNIRKFPIMSISIAIVSNKNRNIDSVLKISEIASELKVKIKSTEGSTYYEDRRFSD